MCYLFYKFHFIEHWIVYFSNIAMSKENKAVVINRYQKILIVENF